MGLYLVYYSNNRVPQDTILAQAIELWMCAYIMTSDLAALVVFLNPAEPPSDFALTIPAISTGQQDDIRSPVTPQSAEIVHKQLTSAAEQRAAYLCKHILQEFEHQMIMRKGSNRAELFVTAVVLLLAAERICCFIKHFDKRVQTGSTAISNGAGAAAPRSDLEIILAPLIGNNPFTESDTDWPLKSVKPAELWQQGEQFSAVIALMLKLRFVTPKMMVSEDGFIHAQDVEEEAIKSYVDGLQLTVAQLEAASQKPFDANDPERWELLWAGKAFLGREQLSGSAI